MTTLFLQSSGFAMDLRFLSLVVGLGVAHISWSTEGCLHYGGEPTSLVGKVRLETFYGPPSYGENTKTDSRETQGILVLARSICVSENPKDYEPQETNQNRITLVPPNGVNLHSYIGKKVVIQGTLFHAYAAHHHTAVLMQVVNINAMPK